MRKIVLLIVGFSLHFFTAHAQPVLLGMPKRGGGAQTGTIVSYTVSTGNLTGVHSFEGIESSGTGKLLKAADGKIYGTHANGRYGYGSVFSFDPQTGTYTTLFDFTGTHGSNPISLLQAGNGLLYGIARNGGTFDYGTLFAYDLQTNQYNKLIDFDGAKGNGPTGLVQAGNGKLYGTAGGGTNNRGVIYSFDPDTKIYEKLKDLDGTNGHAPVGSLVQATNGLLYGMTTYGGKWNRGVIYSFNPATNEFAKLVDFEGANGTYPGPYASLLQAGNGKLYGTTSAGGSHSVGVVFSFTPSTNECKSIKEFDVASGSNPQSDLLELTNGRLFGMTYNGGATNNGVLFSIDPQTNNFIKERDFEMSTGGYPSGNLVLIDGKLYGMNSKNAIGSGDPYGAAFGNIFSFDPALQTYTVHKTFGKNTNGSFASAGLVKASDGLFYGMTINGGSNGYGIIFSFNPGSKIYTKRFDFDGATGGNPYGSLLSAGNTLYGMTAVGGSSNNGVLFSFEPATNSYQIVKDFMGSDGANPYGSLLQAENKLYGMTRAGGDKNLGVIFSFDLITKSYLKLKDFDGLSGANPFGNLTRANNGKLYGMTYAGGNSNLGVIFSFDPNATNSSAYTKLKDFDGSTGAQPYGSLLLAKNGKLYGMTLRGGRTSVKGGFGSAYSTYGLIFSFDPVRNTFTSLKDFDNTGGAHPNGSLMQASNDKIYGMTAGGGAYGKGVLFSCDVSGKNPYSKLKDFDGTNGANPAYGSFLVELGTTSAPLTIHAVGTLANTETGIHSDQTGLLISAQPNPTKGEFALRVGSRSSLPVQIRVLDAGGRTVEVKNNLAANRSILLGTGYRAGVYFIQATQGKQTAVLKLLKDQ